MRKVRSIRKRSAQRAPTSPPRRLPRPFAFEVVTLDALGRETGRRRGRARQLIERLGRRVTLAMAQIPGGTFMMGAPASEAGSPNNERPQHHVTVPPFFLGKHAVTVAQWRAVMGAVPPAMKSLDLKFLNSRRQPVVRVSCDDAEAFCQQLSRIAGRDYRLPTEAEWEYACRAGTIAPFAFGETITRAVANYDVGSLRLTLPAGTDCATTIGAGSLGVANAFGLFDMHGQVWEWCQDWWHSNYDGAPADGSAWRTDADKRTRVLRGGSWFAAAKSCRAAARSFSGMPNVRSREIGFRVAMTAQFGAGGA